MIGLDLMGAARPTSTRWEIVAAVATGVSALCAVGALVLRWRRSG